MFIDNQDYNRYNKRDEQQKYNSIKKCVLLFNALIIIMNNINNVNIIIMYITVCN